MLLLDFNDTEDVHQKCFIERAINDTGLHLSVNFKPLNLRIRIPSLTRETLY